MHSSEENPFAGDIHEKTTLSKKFSHAMHPIKKTFDDGFIHNSSQTDRFGNNSESFSGERLRGLTKKFPVSVNNKQIWNFGFSTSVANCGHGMANVAIFRSQWP